MNNCSSLKHNQQSATTTVACVRHRIYTRFTRVALCRTRHRFSTKGSLLKVISLDLIFCIFLFRTITMLYGLDQRGFDQIKGFAAFQLKLCPLSWGQDTNRNDWVNSENLKITKKRECLLECLVRFLISSASCKRSPL